MFLTKIFIGVLLSVLADHTIAKPVPVKFVPVQPPEQQESENTYESDIKLTPEQMENHASGLSKRKAIDSTFRRWPNRQIHYEFSSGSEVDRAVIISALDHWEEHTCVEFIESNSATDRILFTKQDGCWSYIGRTGGVQEISIGSGCEYLGTVAHEVGHAAGFYHEQSRPDRDSYVDIILGNIISGYESNFAKSNNIDSENVPYDVTSLMHYGKYYFTSNDRPTIQTVDPLLQNVIGARNSLSFQDIHLANVIYECDTACSGPACENGGYRRYTNNCNCICPPGFGGSLCQTAQPIESCSMVINEADGRTGTISSPNYPSAYSNYDNCLYYFTGTSELTITFNAFHLEAVNSNRCWDYVAIQDDDLYHSDYVYCGTNGPADFVDNDGQLIIVFYSDSTITAPGFHLTYEFNTPTQPPPTQPPPTQPPPTQPPPTQPPPTQPPPTQPPPTQPPPTQPPPTQPPPTQPPPTQPPPTQPPPTQPPPTQPPPTQPPPTQPPPTQPPPTQPPPTQPPPTQPPPTQPPTTTEFPTTTEMITTTECPVTSVAARNYALIDENGWQSYKYGFMTAWADVDGDGVANAYCRINKKRRRKFPSCLKADGTRFELDDPRGPQINMGGKKTAFMRDMNGDGKDDFCRCVTEKDNNGNIVAARFLCAVAGETCFRRDEFELTQPPYGGLTSCSMAVDPNTGNFY